MPDQLTFRPDSFFLIPTNGSGRICDAWGRELDRCNIATEAHWDHQVGALHFDEVFTYDSGRVDTLNWVMRPDPQGRMQTSEASVSQIRVWMDGPDYRMRFVRVGPPPFQRGEFLHDVRFSLVERGRAQKCARMKWLGVTLATMNAEHRHAEEPAGSPTGDILLGLS